MSGRRSKHIFRFIAGIAFGFGFGNAAWSIQVENWWSLVVLATGALIYLAIRIVSLQRKMSSIPSFTDHMST